MSYNSQLDKRQYFRYDLLDYAMTFAGDDTTGVRSVIADVGLGGLSIRTHEQLVEGSIVRIVLGRGPDTQLVIKGLVCHSSINTESTLFATGIQFKPETHEERLAIAEYVNGVFQRHCDASAAQQA
jgi:hypothetical protein